VDLRVGFEHRHDSVVEGPHGVRTALVDGTPVEGAHPEVSSHRFVAGHLAPVLFDHLVFKAITELSQLVVEVVFTDLVSLGIGCSHQLGEVANEVVASVHDVVVLVRTDGVVGVEAESDGNHAHDGVGLLVSHPINDCVRKTTSLVGSFALGCRPGGFFVKESVLERLTNVG